MAGLFGRVLWHVNRSPLGHVVKVAVTGAHFREKLERRRLGRTVAGAASRRHVEALVRDGHASVDDLIDQPLLGELAADGDRRLAEIDAQRAASSSAEWVTKKSFWVRLLDEETRKGFSTESIFVRYALQPRVLSLVSAAMGGELPLVSYVLLTLSMPSEAPLAVSQLWHRDHDDTRVIKMFTYLTDVADARDGPFTFIPGAASDRIGFSLKSHRPDDEIFGKVPRDVVKVMTAPRLTTFLVETSRCYHMGSRMAPDHRRLMYTATYISAPSMYPRIAPPFRPAAALDRRTQLLLGLT